MFFLTYLRRELRSRMRQAVIIALGLALGIGLVVTVTAASAGVRQAQADVLRSLYGVGTDVTVTGAAPKPVTPGGTPPKGAQTFQIGPSGAQVCSNGKCHNAAGQTITALEAAKAINATDRQTLAFALQAALCSTNEEWELFPKLFQEFWGESQPRPRSGSGEYKGHSKGKPPEREDGSTVFLDQPANAAAGQDGKGKAVYGASAQQRLKTVDFSEVPCDDVASLEELSLRLLRRMSLRRSVP